MHASPQRSRGATTDLYVLLTPENAIASPLPWFERTTSWSLVTPRAGRAQFGAYLLDLEPGGGTPRGVEAGLESFLYVLDGAAELVLAGEPAALEAGGFAYVPESLEFSLLAGERRARLLWLKRHYEPLPGRAAPGPLVGRRDEVAAEASFMPGISVRALLPLGDPAFDLAVNLLSFESGAAFDRVEIHDQEHGLYLVAGRGVYYLGSSYHEVEAGDFIYMAPYCPQHFAVTGPGGAEYLLYKDWQRDGFGR